jgi:hypothetical protein
LIGHIRTGELASYRAGVVSASRAARISAHLSGCARCTSVDAQLAGVSAALAAVPVPVIPDSVTERLRLALTVEATARRDPEMVPASARVPARSAQASASAAASASAGGGRRRRPDWWSPLLARSLAATGALAVIVVGGGLVLSAVSTHSAGTRAASGSASGPAPGPQAANERGSSGASATASVRYRYDGRYVSANVVTSSTNYVKNTLKSGARAAIAGASSVNPSMAPDQTARPSAVSGPARTSGRIGAFGVSQLSACLSKAADGHQILRAEVARYLARPATIIVLTPVGNVFDVIVVGRSCSASNLDVLTRLVIPKG